MIPAQAVEAAAKVIQREHQIDHQHDTVLHEQCVCGRRWMMGVGKLEAHHAELLAARLQGAMGGWIKGEPVTVQTRVNKHGLREYWEAEGSRWVPVVTVEQAIQYWNRT